MPEQDIQSSDYLQDEARVADLLNVAILHGKRLIRAEDIRELDSAEAAVPGKHISDSLPTLPVAAQAVADSAAETDSAAGKRRKNFRDILCGAVCGCRLLMIGIENQDRIHFAMPLRTLQYDCFRYQKQYRKIKKSTGKIMI